MSDLIEYNVHFEDYASNIVAHFRNLLHFQILVDTTLMCNSNTLKVHKIVLVAASSYFQDILRNKIGELLITLKMNFDVLKSIVEFMYSGKTSFLAIHKEELLSAARFLKITGLVELGFNYTDPLPEFQTPVVFNKPSHITQESQQTLLDFISRDDEMSTQLLEKDSKDKDDNIIRIPIDIKTGETKNKTGQKHSQDQYGLIDYDDSINIEEVQDDNEKLDDNILEANLFKKAARKLQKIEKTSIKAIQQLKDLQKIPFERLEVTDDILNQDMQELTQLL